jgi:hypothetical protein
MGFINNYRSGDEQYEDTDAPGAFVNNGPVTGSQSITYIGSISGDVIEGDVNQGVVYGSFGGSKK